MLWGFHIGTEDRLKTIMDTVLKEEIAKMRLEVDAIKTDLEKKIAFTSGSAFHLQVNQNKDSDPVLALASCESALEEYVIAESERNIRSIIHLVTLLLPRLDKNMSDGVINGEKCLNGIIGILEENNTNGRYELDLNTIIHELKEAKKREPEIKI